MFGVEAERPLLVFEFGEAVIAFVQQKVCADAAGVVEQALRRRVLAADGGAAAAQDAGFFVGDLFDGVAEEGLVVEVDAGDDGDVAVEDVDGIEPPAEADFEDHDVNLFADEDVGGGEGVELEIGERDVVARGFNALEGGGDEAVENGLAVEGNAFVVAQQVGAGEGAGFEAGFSVYGGEEGADRAFAVGAADNDDGAGGVELHAPFYFADAFQAHVDEAVAVGGFEVGEPLAEGFHGGFRVYLWLRPSEKQFGVFRRPLQAPRAFG